MPILQCIKLTVSAEGRLTAYATDTEISLSVHVDGVTVERPGEVCVSADSMRSLLAKIDDELVKITVGDSGCEIASESDLFTLPVEDAENMPSARETIATNDDSRWEMDCGAFGRQIGRAKYAASKKESSRYATTGVFLSLDRENVVVAATDTKALSIVDVKASFGVGKWSGIAPLKAMSLAVELAKHFEDDGAPVVLICTSNALEFQFSGATLTTRLVEGRFPPYRDIVPKNTPIVAVIVVESLVKACKKALVVLGKESARCDMAFSNNRLEFASQTDKGKVLTSVPIQYTGDAFGVGLDVEYVIELANASNATSLTFKAKDAESPVLFTSDDGFMGLIMPMCN